MTGVAVVSPTFLTGSDGRAAALAALTRLREEAAVQSVTVRRRMRQGNPVRIIAGLARDADLIVLGIGEGHVSAFRPGINGHLVPRVECSVLLVPAVS